MTTDLQGSSANRLSSAPRGAAPMTDHDVYLFKEGSHLRLYQRLGSHPGESGGAAGCWFGVWAPNAAAVSVIGDFNGWDRASHPLQVRADGSGVWEGFVAGAEHGHCYKY